MRTVITFDVSSNKKRYRVVRALLGRAQRVQKSVFECRLTQSSRSELIRKLEALEIRTGFVKVYRLEYVAKSPVIGKPPGGNLDDGFRPRNLWAGGDGGHV